MELLITLALNAALIYGIVRIIKNGLASPDEKEQLKIALKELHKKGLI